MPTVRLIREPGSTDTDGSVAGLVPDSPDRRVVELGPTCLVTAGAPGAVKVTVAAGRRCCDLSRQHALLALGPGDDHEVVHLDRAQGDVHAVGRLVGHRRLLRGRQLAAGEGQRPGHGQPTDRTEVLRRTTSWGARVVGRVTAPRVPGGLPSLEPGLGRGTPVARRPQSGGRARCRALTALTALTARPAARQSPRAAHAMHADAASVKAGSVSAWPLTCVNAVSRVPERA